MTTHKEMTLEPCREAFEKWFLGQDANMPIDLRKREDGEYEFLHAESDWTAWQAAWNTRHLATLREDGGEPCCDVDLNETVWHDKYHQLCERCWKALGITEYTGLSIPEHIAALKNPSDAGGAKAKLEITRALNDARRCTNNVVSQGPMGSVTFEQGCAARDYIDRALVILESSKPAPPQADAPIKGAGDIEPTDADLHKLRYAKGHYCIECSNCGQQVMDCDKLALLCRPCAVAEWRAHFYTTTPAPPQADAPIKGAGELGEAVIVRVIKEDLGWKGTCTRIGEEYACVPDKPPTVEGWHVIGTVLHIAKDCGEVIPFFTKNPATLQREYAALIATPAPIDAEVREALDMDELKEFLRLIAFPKRGTPEENMDIMGLVGTATKLLFATGYKYGD